MKILIRLLAALLGLAVLASVIGLGILLTPPPLDLRTPLEGSQTPIDGRTGLYADAEGTAWLVAPALSTGLVAFPVSSWDRPIQGESDEALLDGLERLPDQPYTLRDVAVDVPDHLAGWLFVPTGEIRGGIVIIHGSGTSDRGNSWYVFLAHELAAAGYAVLLPDKRGSGRSDGDWRNSSIQLAGDAAAWMEELRQEAPGVAFTGFLGISQGGGIAPEAARLAGSDFAVSLSSSAGPLRDALRFEVGNDVKHSGAPGVLRPLLTSLFSLRVERRHPMFWKLNADHDMLAEWAQWKGPLFVAMGRDDEAGSVAVTDTANRIAALGPDVPIEVHIYDDTAHSLMGSDNRFVPGLMPDLLGWLDGVHESTVSNP
ncbi:MAG: alpha/beta fold hydrolase [Hyphomonas sp.]